MPFEKGQSGNPKGRPSGVRDRRAVLSDLLSPHAPALVAKAVERALEGDQLLLKACLDKLIPSARSSRHATIARGAGASTDVILAAAMSSDISLEDAKSFMELLSMKARVDEVTELRTRLERLEARDESAA